MKSINLRLFLSLIVSLAHAVADKPNIVLIYADDLGFGDLSCYGATKVSTPNIDQLANQGKRFTDAHSASPICTPARHALLTGDNPFRTPKMVGPLPLGGPLIIDENRYTIADMLKAAGYNTACIGKWHLGFQKTKTNWNIPLSPGPLDLGFDYYYGVPFVNSHPPFILVENTSVIGHDPKDPIVYNKRSENNPSVSKKFREKWGYEWIGGGRKAHEAYDDEKLGTHLKDKAIAYIQQEAKDKSKPFFLFFATTNIHHPFTPAPRFKGTSKAGIYGDFIHELDWMVGEVLKSLDQAGVADNTLVILTSDNGGMLNIGGQEAVALGHRLNGDLQGYKFDAWEGGHRVPFIVRWPGKTKPGTVSDQFILTSDLFASFAAMTGQKIPKDQAKDSFNVLPTFITENEASPRTEAVLSSAGNRNRALRQGDWVYINNRGGGGFMNKKQGTHAFGGPAAFPFTGNKNSDIENGKYKKDAPHAQLYQLRTDPRQQVNVIGKHPDKAQAMKKRLAEILASKRTAP